MLRNQNQTILDAIIEQCRETADLYREAAKLTADQDDFAKLFTGLAGRRDRTAAELEGHLRGLGDLPGAPDPDRTTLDEVLVRIKAAWATDQRLELLEERRRAEESLSARIAEALALNYPENTKIALAAAREEAAAAEKELRSAAEAIVDRRGLD